jgi:hypothetical protein
VSVNLVAARRHPVPEQRAQSVKISYPDLAACFLHNGLLRLCFGYWATAWHALKAIYFEANL